jgi:hypothetical protein
MLILQKDVQRCNLFQAENPKDLTGLKDCKDKPTNQ